MTDCTSTHRHHRNRVTRHQGPKQEKNMWTISCRYIMVCKVHWTPRGVWRGSIVEATLVLAHNFTQGFSAIMEKKLLFFFFVSRPTEESHLLMWLPLVDFFLASKWLSLFQSCCYVTRKGPKASIKLLSSWVCFPSNCMLMLLPLPFFVFLICQDIGWFYVFFSICIHKHLLWGQTNVNRTNAENERKSLFISVSITNMEL